MTFKMPALFIGHGSPMNAISDNEFVKSLRTIAKEIPKPKAILVISAHYLTKGTFITSHVKQRQIYDFGGFPEELYRVTYEPPVYPKLANYIASKIKAIETSEKWGIDHGAWTVLKHLYPKADIPVLQLSLDYSKPESYHYELGKELSFLREEGILILGSGNITHNLGLVNFSQVEATPYQWAIQTHSEIKELILDANYQALITYPYSSEIAIKAIPSNDHFLPLLYIMALKNQSDNVEIFHQGIQHSSISMLSFIIKQTL